MTAPSTDGNLTFQRVRNAEAYRCRDQQIRARASFWGYAVQSHCTRVACPSYRICEGGRDPSLDLEIALNNKQPHNAHWNSGLEHAARVDPAHSI